MSEKKLSDNKMSQYIRQHYTWLNIQFRTDNPEEMAILQWLNEKGRDRTKYIKTLIKKDMQQAGR